MSPVQRKMLITAETIRFSLLRTIPRLQAIFLRKKTPYGTKLNAAKMLKKVPYLKRILYIF